MKSDLDRLMAARELDGLLVASAEGYDVIRDYLANGARITGGLIVKRRGGDPLLVVNSMEIEEARQSGLAVKTFTELGLYDLLREHSDHEAAITALWVRALAEVGLESGTIGLYGSGAINVTVERIKILSRDFPQFSFIGETGLTLFDEAFTTKDTDEMARIQSVAERTDAALNAVWDFISAHRAQGEAVVNANGYPLTIGAVKRRVRLELLMRELEDTGMIFAQGRDAGFPHSRGQDDQALLTGQAIVFDLFPRELGGGYHHDMTRTWCLGYAPEPVQQAYDQVMAAFELALAHFQLGQPTCHMQERVQDYFESLGHATTRSAPGAMDGYVHSLGHGIGLNVHERPSISHLRREDRFEVGNCITIEPGLYYPEQGFGVRVEDLFIITAAGQLQSLTPFRKDLVLPLLG